MNNVGIKDSQLNSLNDGQGQIEKIWLDFKNNDSQEARDKLILEYSPIVKYVASRVSINLPANVEQSDLVSYGLFGLIDAIEKFDPSRNIKFETYAIARIRGSIMDELRSLDWMPRVLRKKSKELEKAYYKLEMSLKRAPKDKELARELGMDIDELKTLLSKLSYGSILALDDTISYGDKSYDFSLIDNIEDKTGDDPVSVSEFHETKKLIATAIDALPEKEKTVVSLYYYEGLTLKEIGEILNVTESRASQIHTKAILYLKSKLSHMKELPKLF